MTEKHKVVYVLSNLEKAVAFEWIADHFNHLSCEIIFVLLNPGPTALESELNKRNRIVFRIPYTGKKDLPRAIFTLLKILKKEKPTVVHTHLFDANLCGLTAAFLSGVNKRIYSRHHSTFHHDYFPKAVKYDKYCNFLATHIVAISENVKTTLIKLENVQPKKITVIHHGFNMNEFESIEESRVVNMRSKYDLTEASPVIGISSRYLYLKGLQYAIPAFGKILAEYPNAKLVLANASGSEETLVQGCLSLLPIGSYVEIPFEHDFIALFKCFDVFVHVPINRTCEAFGQIYVEALAAGIPSVFTLSGVASEFIQDGYNAVVVGYCNSEAIYTGVKKLLEDKEYALNLSRNGKNSVIEKFGLHHMIKKLELLYLS